MDEIRTRDPMASGARTPRLAVLIDAENASAEIATGLFLEIAKIGEASVRRIYGDFSGTRLAGWANILATYAIVPFQNFSYTSRKNASDIALVIDAMDLLHSGRFDGFCLVSSESDFTRLAARIREQGIDAYGFGERKTPASFRQACRRFFYTENLLPKALTPVRAVSQQELPATALQALSSVTKLLRTATVELDGEDGWVHLGQIGQRLANLAPDFDPRIYGHAKLSALVKKTGAFEIKTEAGRGMFIRPTAETA